MGETLLKKFLTMMEKWQKLYYLALDGAAVKTTKVICGDTITYKVLLYI